MTAVASKATTPKPKPRRTQEERREGTIRKLLDAAIAALVDVGYAEASVQVICARAGVSQGALFRHFPTREALMVAVAADVGKKTLASYRREFDALRGNGEPVTVALRLVRSHARSRPNQAWYELAVAARTHEKLRRALEPMALAYYAGIEAMARQLLPEVAARAGAAFPLLVETVLAVFDGESMHRFVVPGTKADDARIQLLAAFVASTR